MLSPMQALTHLPKAQRLRVADAGVVWDHRRAMFVDSTYAAAVNVLAMNNAVYAQAASRDAAGTGEEEDDAVSAESDRNGTSPVGGSLAARFVALRNEYSELQAKYNASTSKDAERLREVENERDEVRSGARRAVDAQGMRRALRFPCAVTRAREPSFCAADDATLLAAGH